jgi:hypothetical protein
MMLYLMSKICRVCRASKSETEFYVHKTAKDGRRNECAECTREYRSRYRADNPDIVKKSSSKYYRKNAAKLKAQAVEQNVLKKFGLDADGYDHILNMQGGVCAICKEECSSGRRLAVDHDHACCEGKASCGKCLRGLLCFKCNSAIGLFSDSEQLLRSALNYLENGGVIGDRLARN